MGPEAFSTTFDFVPPDPEVAPTRREAGARGGEAQGGRWREVHGTRRARKDYEAVSINLANFMYRAWGMMVAK